ncbi:phosphatidylinositol N-acetylglucosaminyltransferase subunit P [Andrographis paniculata]|uniref:phosphatidylinositol N-acetylglucosaminyltransferase subunit P n=1 Tax=Andrographis paniculata TaxID=175694 RepID=UPI0021E76D7B|nr:phosphatidylinositol N-acetylglucosaminyltransferase subunit P [Andrographis paniculata]XP_051151054.1 phosphatidylinositol N-acetylglucosaminyltransferase subunit P [Andrographis paniculata]
MEERYSVNSPRRILSFSRMRKANDTPRRSSTGFGVSGEHGPKLSEVYGFVGSITTVVSTVVFIMWAYVPDRWLHSVGICYFPSRYWALVVPTYGMVTIALAILLYLGMNFMATPPPTSFNSMFDEFSREPESRTPSADSEELPIEPISDIAIDQINNIMFKNLN